MAKSSSLLPSYIDDITFSVTDTETRDFFMHELTERFEIGEDEEKPIEWLLGMLIIQDIEAGTITMSMEAMITKLATSILTSKRRIGKVQKCTFSYACQPFSQE